MAEGGRDDPAIDGQDEVLEWPCKICAEENLIKESVAYCKNCDGCFCKSCLQYHGKFQKAHTVLRIEEKDDWGKPKLAQDTGIECSDHPGQTLSMYCGRHDDVCCPECVSLIHGESCKLSFLPKIAKGVTTGEEFEAAMKTMNSLVIYFTKLGEEYADFKTQLDKSRETCSRSIDDFNTELANLLQNLKESSLTELEEMHDAIDKINRENIEKCCKVKQELQDMQQQMQITPQVNESLLFVYLKNCQKLLPKCSDIATALTAKEQHTIEFQRSQPLLHVIQTVDSFGTCIKSRSVTCLQYLEWCYAEGDGSILVPYPKHIAFNLEEAYDNGSTEIKFKDSDDKEYVVDLNNFKEYEASCKDKTKAIAVVRKDLKAENVNIPDYWLMMGETENLKRVVLKSNDQEYQDVEKQFQTTLGRKAAVKQIERIQNRTLYRLYETKKKELKSKCQNTTVNRELWHGAKEDCELSVLSYGFNRSYSGQTHGGNVWYGHGCYFAVQSSYADGPAYSPPYADGFKRVYVVDVLIGATTKVNRGYQDRYAPLLPNSQNDRYDSVCDDVNKPTEFVIFKDTQAYPKYIIKFK